MVDMAEDCKTIKKLRNNKEGEAEKQERYYY
jgi:hypothetical protein